MAGSMRLANMDPHVNPEAVVYTTPRVIARSDIGSPQVTVRHDRSRRQALITAIPPLRFWHHVRPRFALVAHGGLGFSYTLS